MDLLAQSHAQFRDERLDQEQKERKSLLRINLDKQSKLTSAYLEGTIAPEVFRERCALLRSEEQELRKAITELEMALIERERSAEYQRLLQRVLEDIEGVEQKLDVIRKKELLRLIFKKVLIDDGRIQGLEMYEPFQKMYNEVLNGLNTREVKELTQVCQDDCTLAPTAAR